MAASPGLFGRSVACAIAERKAGDDAGRLVARLGPASPAPDRDGDADAGAGQAPPLTYNPKHFQNDDPIWDVLNTVTVSADRAKGEYLAKFPSSLSARQGQRLRIPGFILPLEPSSRSAHFMVVRRNTGCPFCPPNAPTEAVEVRSLAPVSYTGEEVIATGRLQLVSSSGDGLFFRLEDASVDLARP